MTTVSLELSPETVAERMLRSGMKPGYSKGLLGEITCGYGRLDKYGYWQYPLEISKTDRLQRIKANDRI